MKVAPRPILQGHPNSSPSWAQAGPKMGPYGAIRAHVGPMWIQMAHGPYGAHMAHGDPIWAHVANGGPYGPLMDHHGPRGVGGANIDRRFA